MSGNGHERWREELPAYLLGALEPGETEAMERHLKACEGCREEASWFEPAVRALPEGVPRLEAPPALRERLLAEVGAAPGPDAKRAAGQGSRVASWLRGLGSGAGARRPLPAALAVAALLLVGAVGYRIGEGGGPASGPVDGVIVEHAPGLTASMVRVGAGGTLRLAHLHQLPAGEVLEAWVRRDGTIEPVQALFVPNRAGRATAAIEDMSGVDTVMVTEEPKGGSTEPSSEPILTMEVNQ